MVMLLAFWLCASVPLLASSPEWVSPPELRMRPRGIVQARVAANIESWLLPAPLANPGMLEMFRLRDREPKPNLVPWAGEFVGKYLLSAIQTLSMDDSPALRARVESVVSGLLATQAEDGYLGPFPKAERLRGHWDLWGHYHAMQALLLWHQFTGDPAALAACEKAGELVCRTFLDGSIRVIDAGSPEMNMAIIHSLGQLHRVTGEPRLARMMVEIAKDWERAGDYFRLGLKHRDFYTTPFPRWESLHDIQGLLEMAMLTGDTRYAEAFENLWRGIARWDLHNAGSFTTGEQATGNPYADGAIETCCTVAWMALTVDMLRLRGSSLVADELDLSFFNGGLGAQHPSGRWWTYSTPMDGIREASAHSIVFQARAGSPELNCCSVNGPRVIGMLRDWALLASTGELMLNHLAPARYTGEMPDGGRFAFDVSGEYPRGPEFELHMEEVPETLEQLLIRIPAWSRRTFVVVNGEALPQPKSGEHMVLRRPWKRGDRVSIRFDFSPRALAGDKDALGKVSLYWGPLLLAWDQRWNRHDESGIPALDLSKLPMATKLDVLGGEEPPTTVPWLLLEAPTEGGDRLILSDYANAGSQGTRYRSWLAAADPPPPPPIARRPADGQRLPPGEIAFRWSGPSGTNSHVHAWRFWIAADPHGETKLWETANVRSNFVVVPASALAALETNKEYYWRAHSLNRHGESQSLGPPSRFTIDPDLPSQSAASPPETRISKRLLLADSLRGAPGPDPGEILRANSRFDGQRFQGFNGIDQRITYRLPEFPGHSLTAMFWFRLGAFPKDRLGQLLSAWSGPMDDPIRICVEGGRVFARVEAGRGYSTAGFTVKVGETRHVAVVKEGEELRFYLDAALVATMWVPEQLETRSRDLALGGNPHHIGPEFLKAEMGGFQFWAGCLDEEEIVEAARIALEEMDGEGVRP